MEFDFGYILNPLTIEDFFANYYEKKPLVIKRNQPNYYDPVLTINDVNDLLSNSDLIYPNLFMVKQSEGATHTEYTYNVTAANKPPIEGIVDKEKLFSLFSEGNTIVLNALDRHFSKIHRLCFVTETTFNARAQANFYLTPINSQGFEAHWDTHDVFLLQIGGSKNWKLFESPIELPSKKQSYNGGWTRTTPTHDFVLEQGDLLYIPRGFIHEGHSTENISLHITLGIHTFKYSDIVRELVKNIEDELFFRKSLPLANSLNSLQIKEFQERIMRYISEDKIGNALNYIKESFISRRLIDATDRLNDYINLKNISISSILTKRERILFEIRSTDNFVELRFYNKSIKFPLHVKKSIEFIIQTECFKIADIDENIDDSGKLIVCKKLIEEGFLSIMSI